MAQDSTRKLTHGPGGGPRFLVVYTPNHQAPTRHLVTVGRIVIGRAPTCEVVVDHETVSRQHAALHVEADRVLVEDLESANGTAVAGVPVTGGPVVVPIGAMFSIGEVVVLLRAGPEEEAESQREGGGAMQLTDRVVDLVAPTQLPVLILGETGVGKEVVAERIVRASSRASAPFVRINCAALTESLFESELFGHERGAFTGADRTKVGLLESADGGSVLLDEVGDLPLAAQAKLLRVLESGDTTRVGSVTPKRIDVRFIAATNRDLGTMVEAGTFRSDLLYRLDGVTISVPPLRERKSEIPSLARSLLETACRAVGREPPTVSEGAMTILVRHEWPGNVRELRRVMDRIAALVRGDTVQESDLGAVLGGASGRRDSKVPEARLPDEVKAEVEAIERTRIEDALRRAAGNQTQAAKLLGISRRTLIDRIDRFGLPRPRKP